MHGLAFAGARAVEANNDLAAILGKKFQSSHEPVTATFLMQASDGPISVVPEWKCDGSMPWHPKSCLSSNCGRKCIGEVAIHKW